MQKRYFQKRNNFPPFTLMTKTYKYAFLFSPFTHVQSKVFMIRNFNAESDVYNSYTLKRFLSKTFSERKIKD